MMQTKAGYLSLSKTSLINTYNIQSNSLLQHLEQNLNKRGPDRQYFYNRYMKEQEFEQKWENQFLRQQQQLQEQISADQPALSYSKNKSHIEYRGDRLSRQINLGTVQKAINKSKKKEFQKFKAYAVKLKIPSFNQLNKPRQREDRNHLNVKDKNSSSGTYINQIYEFINPKIGRSPQETNKQHIKTRNYQSINEKQIFNRNVKSSQNQRNLNIRKRSIKHAQKKEDHYIQNEIQKSNECSPNKLGISIKGLKKAKKASERITPATYFDSKNFEQKQRDKSEGMRNQIHVRQVPAQEKLLKSSETVQKPETSKIDYLQKGISFKRREKQSLKQVQNLNQKKISVILSKKIKKQSSLQHMKQAEPKEIQVIVRQTPRNFLLQSLIMSKDPKLRKNQNIDEAKSMNKQQKCIKQTKINKVISFNSEDKYIRRILLSLGWVLNPDRKSKFYHLKWVFKPSSEDYNQIREGQYINHIKNSHQLTSKHCLNKNLKKNLSQWTNLYNFYPQCYDISKSAQKQQFFQEYTKQFMMLLLRKIYMYVYRVQFETIQKLREKYQKLLGEDGLYCSDTKHMSFMRQKQFRNIEMENYKSFKASFTLHINLLTAALKYWRFLRKQQQFEEQDCYHFLNYSQKEFENNIGYLERYSQMSTPTYISDSIQYFTKEFYSTPSNIVLERIVKEYVYFHRKYNQRWTIFGDKNIWIVKPCSASRGNGIYLQNNCRQILFNSKGIQSRIVQKYIERPLLFKNRNFPEIYNRKFDIRQWVLLRSVDPLEIHIFSHFYVRICSEDYNIENINNLKCHLTNYSFNKQYFKDPAESVLDYNTFKSLLMQEYKVDYEKQIKEKIKKIIIKSIKSAQDLLNDFNKRCFSLLGYDILLDQNFNPWLLEVNMSPACQQRTQWLKNYLKEMGKGLLQIVLPKEYLQMQNEYNSSSNHNDCKQKQKRIESTPKDIIELKRIKTEITHQAINLIQQNKSNRNFNQSKITAEKWQYRQLQIQQNLNGSVVYEQEQQITYSDFIKENLLTEEEYEINDLQLEKTEEAKNNEINQYQFQDVGLQFNKINNNKSIRIESQMSLPAQATKFKSESQMQVESDQQEPNDLKIQNQFKWQLICFQEYYRKRKQIDGLIDIGGIRISNEVIRSNDIKIDQFEQSREQIIISITKVQTKIKEFLQHKLLLQKNKQQQRIEKQQINIQNKQIREQNLKIQKQQQKIDSPIKSEISLEQKQKEQKQSLKLNFSYMGHKSNLQRKLRSRSVIDSQIDSIWHYSYVHKYREGTIEKVQVAKNESVYSKKLPKQKRLKNFYENKLRDKIISAAVNAVADVSVSYLQQIILKRNNKQAKEEILQHLKSEISIDGQGQQQVENQIKQNQSLDFIE